MSTFRILYHIARADFLERTRRYSFLVMLGFVLFLGYAVITGQIILRLGEQYRGVLNSAWAGSLMVLVINFFLGWFGFYLVNNSISRDYETGVGQIIATTPLKRPFYTLGKWLSNFSVLGMMVSILLLASLVMQLVYREDPAINLQALFAPFLLLALPLVALTSAVAVLFETIGWLRGGLGNVVYFFLFTLGFTTIGIIGGSDNPMLDFPGFAILNASMEQAAKAAYPDYPGGFDLTFTAPDKFLTFYWGGVDWTWQVILSRLVIVAIALGTTLLAAIFFDRFNPSRELRRKKRMMESNAPTPAYTTEPAPAAVTAHLTPLAASPAHFRLGTLVIAELRLILKGLPWWWYIIALGLMVAPVFSTLDIAKQTLLPAAWIWCLLQWSSLGSRENRFDTRQFVFSAPHPLRSQVLSAWLAGFIITVLMGMGSALRLCMAGDSLGLLTLSCGALFIPSLALALGVWTGSRKAFEVIYVLFWYGAVRQIIALDFMGTSSASPWLAYLCIAIGLFALALLGRKRQISEA